MKSVQVLGSLVLGLSFSAAVGLQAQVATEVPPVVPGAQPVTVEHIKIHGKSLEGNLEGDVVDSRVARVPLRKLFNCDHVFLFLAARCTTFRTAPRSLKCSLVKPHVMNSDGLVSTLPSKK